MIVSFTWLQDSNLQAWATAQIQIGNISYAEYVYDHFTQLESKQLNLDVVNPANTSSITIYLAHPTSVLLLCNSIIKNWKDFKNAMRWCLLDFFNITEMLQQSIILYEDACRTKLLQIFCRKDGWVMGFLG